MKLTKRMTEMQLRGIKVRLLREVSTVGGRIFGAGTEMTITGKRKGLELEQITKCDKCGCGNRYQIRHVNYTDVEVIE